MVPPMERELPLAGAHQRQNAALAVAAAKALLPDIHEQAINLGLERLRWPGRFEVIGERPPVVLDGAHNGASAAALAETLRHFAAGRPIRLVVGINRDKDARAVLRPLLPLADQVWATQARDNRRALSAEELARLCRKLGAHAEAEPDLSAALERAMRMSGASKKTVAREKTEQTVDSVVCLTGSLMLVGQARATLGVPAPERLW